MGHRASRVLEASPAQSSIVRRPIRGTCGRRVRPRRRDGRFPSHVRPDFLADRPALPDRATRGRDARWGAHARARGPDSDGSAPCDQPRRDRAPGGHDAARVRTGDLWILRSRFVADRGPCEKPGRVPRVAHGRDGGVVSSRAERHDRVARDAGRDSKHAGLAGESTSVPRRRRDRGKRRERGHRSRQPPERIHRDRSGIPFLTFTAYLLPVTIACLVAAIGLVWLAFRKDLAVPLTPISSVEPVRLQRTGLVVTLGVTVGVAVAFFASPTPAWLPLVALAGGSFVLFFLPFFAKTTARTLIAKVDWSIILFFVGLFIVLEGVRVSGLSAAIQGGF